MDNILETILNMDSAFWITIFAIFSLLVLSAFFSGSETALTAASRGKLRAIADKGSKPAKRALSLTERTEQLIGAVLLGNNLVNILAASLATSLFTRIFGDSGVALATLVMTLLVLIFAEVLPKTYAITNPERASMRVAAPIRVIVFLFSPIVATVQFFVSALLRLLGVKNSADEADAAQDEIAGAIALGHSEGNFEKDDKDRLLGALDLKDREVDEIMLHRSNIEMVDIGDEPKAILSQCLNSPHTRLPVFKDQPENIVGVLHAKDLLRHLNSLDDPKRRKTKSKPKTDDLDIMDVVKVPYFVPETTSLDDQMREFLRRKTHFALVVDEYGDLQGLITLEDILEEIVGEIQDEFDEEVQEAEKADSDGNFEVEGIATIRDLNRLYDWNLPDSEANTIAGLVIHEAQSIPNEGQAFNFHGFHFEIIKRERNQITKLKVRPL